MFVFVFAESFVCVCVFFFIVFSNPVGIWLGVEKKLVGVASCLSLAEERQAGLAGLAEAKTVGTTFTRANLNSGGMPAGPKGDVLCGTSPAVVAVAGGSSPLTHLKGRSQVRVVVCFFLGNCVFVFCFFF